MLSLLLLLACAPAPTTNGQPRTLTLAGYTTPREVYGQAVLPGFAKMWKAKTGSDVTFVESYQGSSAQARAVRDGLEADVVALSLDQDVDMLEDAGLVKHNWRGATNGGIVTYSLAVIAVRPGNPKNLRDWPDLARPDVSVLTPNVRTSGGARWNVLAIWGSALRQRPQVNDPEQLLSRILANVPVQDAGARESLLTFEKGIGDAAITYENEALLARHEGHAITYVVPPSTILIENPIAVVDAYAQKHGNADLAAAFVEYCLSSEAQRAYASFGLRPIAAADTPPDLPIAEDGFTVKDLGGWDKLQTEIFATGAAYDRALAAAGK